MAATVASTAILAAADIDAERSRLYLDLILFSLSRSNRKALESTMNSLGFEYQSDFARHYFFQGKAEGKVEVVLRQLEVRFGPLNEAARTVVLDAQPQQLDLLAERVLTARTLEEALGAP